MAHGPGLALDRAWAVAVGARSLGLVAAADGELEEAEARLAGAVERKRALAMPIELGRPLLAHGRALRRVKRKRPARDALEEAGALFSATGAELWNGAVREELARIGGRAPSMLDLTQTEREVARLAASGRSNKEIAARLFMSPKTVKSNLARVFRKAGARSRTQLGHLISSGRSMD